jgi:hypothetical protein
LVLIILEYHDLVGNKIHLLLHTLDIECVKSDLNALGFQAEEVKVTEDVTRIQPGIVRRGKVAIPSNCAIEEDLAVTRLV